MIERKLAVMQPYIFPYIGYFNLVHACTEFVFYDDVNFIPRGWINRNCILTTNGTYRFTVPLQNPSRNRQINEIKLYNFDNYKNQLIKTITQSYSNSKFFEQGMDYVKSVFNEETDLISELAMNSVSKALSLAGLHRNVYISSERFPNSKGIGINERIITIAKSLDCHTYINPVGGRELYCKQKFHQHGIDLQFLRPTLKEYNQVNASCFSPQLSILDLLMNQSLAEIAEHLNSYEICS